MKTASKPLPRDRRASEVGSCGELVNSRACRKSVNRTEAAEPEAAEDIRYGLPAGVAVLIVEGLAYVSRDLVNALATLPAKREGGAL